MTTLDQHPKPPPDGADASGPTVRWDPSRGRTVVADACTVGSAPDAIALLFGTADPADRDGEVVVRLATRIVLSPHVAARLASALREALGRRDAPDAPSGSRPPHAGPAPRFLLPAPPESVAAARALLGLVRGLETPFGLERSFKMSPGSLKANRFLVTMHKGAIKGAAAERIPTICERLQMPEPLRAVLDARLPEATYVHFGFEDAGGGFLFKAYLEFWSTWEHELSRRAADPAPFLLHLGLKWDPSRPGRAAVTRYICHPLLTVEGIRRRLSEIYPEPAVAAPRTAVEAVLARVAARLDPHRVLYVEATEEGNPRRSFDVNVYRARLRVQDVDPCLLPLRAHYALPDAAFRRVYEPARPLPLGHIAGGLDRQGRDFLTVYYGIEEHGPGARGGRRESAR